MKTLKLLVWLINNPGWHYGLDLVHANVSGRSMVYIRLGTLIDMGVVEMTEDDLPGVAVPRPRYRFQANRGEKQ